MSNSISIRGVKFSAIGYDDQVLGKVLQAFVIAGSQVGTVCMKDLTIINYVIDERAEVTLKSLLQGGTKIMDALLYLSVPNEDRVDPGRVDIVAVEYSPDQIARDVFVLFFALLSQARAITDDLFMAAFLKNVMGVNENASVIARRLASFNLQKMRHTWVKYIKIEGLGVEARNRLALGVAGYRMPSALIYTEPDAVFIPSSGVSAVQFNRFNEIAIRVREVIKGWLNEGLHWYAHPLCRSADFISRLKSLNKACGDMLVFLFSDDTLTRMVQQKVIFAKPTADPRARNWIEWNEDTFDFISDPIFPDSE